MPKTYLQVYFELDPCSETARDILTSHLSDVGFDGFEEEKNGLYAYILSEKFDSKKVKKISFKLDGKPVDIQFSEKILREKNWNKEWEKKFKPIVVSDKCIIRASFHETDDKFEYDLVIDPKMSFGTGHHETTHLVIKTMLNMSFIGKNVLDMGCGTGVLAILAKKMGAKQVMAVDNDEWAYFNCVDNCKTNNVTEIEVKLGNASSTGNQIFDIIIANINRNVLVADMDKYAKKLKKGGVTILSGFYFEDIKIIKEKAEKYGLRLISFDEMNKWAMVKMIRN